MIGIEEPPIVHEVRGAVSVMCEACKTEYPKQKCYGCNALTLADRVKELTARVRVLENQLDNLTKGV